MRFPASFRNWWALLLAVLGAIFNWLFRGGGIESAFMGYKNFSPGKGINALAFGGAAWLQSGSAGVAGFLAAAMYVGQGPGWHDYIAAMRGQTPDKSRLWGVCTMSLRGLFWGGLLALGGFGAYWLGLVPLPAVYGVLCLISGLLMGPVYYGAIRLYEVTGWPQNRFINDWTLAEVIQGVLIWLPIWFL